MKIVFVSGHKKNWAAGASSVYLHLRQEIQKLGHTVSLLNQEDYLGKRWPATVRRLFSGFFVKHKAVSLARQADVLEVAGNIGWRLFGALRAQKPVNRPLFVVRLHGLEFKDEQARITEEIARVTRLPPKYKLLSRHWTNWQESKTLKRADVVICHSSREADALVTAKLKSESHVETCPLGVDQDFILQRTYRTHAQKILWWGSWVIRKGIFTLPRAIALAAAKVPDLQLTIAGSGVPPQDVLPSFAPELRSRIAVLPFVPKEQCKSILLDHDLSLFTSLSEGFGLALLEAMATGMPCIATLTGMYDWLEHGQNCYVVPMNAPTAIADAVHRLSHNMDLRKAIGTRASQTAKELTWARSGKRTIDIYAKHRSCLLSN